MEPDGLAKFERRLCEAQVYLEYGAGGSTVLAAQCGPKEIHTVESDKNFLDAVQRRVEVLSVSTRLQTYYVDIGPTKEWGWPTDATCAARWPAYCLAPWVPLAETHNPPDLILIDGRFRVACFLTSLMFAKPGTAVLFDDYLDRPEYHVVQKHVEQTGRAGRMAEFLVPEEIDRRSVLADLLTHVTNPA
jgi:hypothetical protein